MKRSIPIPIVNTAKAKLQPDRRLPPQSPPPSPPVGWESKLEDVRSKGGVFDDKSGRWIDPLANNSETVHFTFSKDVPSISIQKSE